MFSCPQFSSQDYKDIISAITPLAKERFGITITMESLPVPYGGAMDGMAFAIDETLLAQDPEYALYALIHAGLGHNYQLADPNNYIHTVYKIRPEHHPNANIIGNIQAVEAEATAYGVAMLKQILPSSSFMDQIAPFARYWFTQDWALVENYYKTGAYPVFGVRADISQSQLLDIPDVTLQTDFWVEKPVLKRFIYFHATAAIANDNPVPENSPAIKPKHNLG